jgi:predicted PurR-regulated permease PerM
MDYPVFIVNIIVHVAVMIIFLTFFFFTIAAHQEQTITKNQLDFLLNDSIKNQLSALPTDIKNKIKKQLSTSLNKNKDELIKQGKEVSKKNQALFDYMVKLVIIIVISVVIIVIVSYFYFKWNISNLRYILTSAGVTLIFVAITETIFLYLIPTNYLAVDPNQVKYKIVNKILVSN